MNNNPRRTLGSSHNDEAEENEYEDANTQGLEGIESKMNLILKRLDESAMRNKKPQNIVKRYLTASKSTIKKNADTPSRSSAKKDPLEDFETLDPDELLDVKNWRPKRRDTVFGPYLAPDTTLHKAPSTLTKPFVSAIQFTSLVASYEREHGIELPVTTLIVGNARHRLKAHDSEINTEEDFLSMTNTRVLELLQEVVRPPSLASFLEALRVQIKLDLPENFTLEPFNFKMLYDAYLVYKEKWLIRYTYMSKDNEVNIPQCHDKDGGLIHLYLYGLNMYPYFIGLYRRLPRDLIKTFHGEDGFAEFQYVYLEAMKKDFEKFLVAKDFEISPRTKPAEKTGEYHTPMCRMAGI